MLGQMLRAHVHHSSLEGCSSATLPAISGFAEMSNFPARLAGFMKDVLSPHPVCHYAQQQTLRILLGLL